MKSERGYIEGGTLEAVREEMKGDRRRRSEKEVWKGGRVKGRRKG